MQIETAHATSMPQIAHSPLQDVGEHQRCDSLAHTNRLLEGVVAASRALLQDDDFQTAMTHWLAYLATSVDADRAMYGDFTSTSPEGTVATAHLDWTRPGLASQDAEVPATSDFQAWTERLARGETVWAHRDELLDPASARYWASTGCWTNLIVPVVVDDSTVGWLCFDFNTRREWQPALGTVLRTAADVAAGAIKRQWAVQAMLAERDRRIEAERARAEESARLAARADRHAQLLAAVAAAAEDLLAARDPAVCMDTILQRLGDKSGALRAALNRFDWTPDDAVLLGWQEVAHEWTVPGLVRQMDTPMRRFPMRRDEPIYTEFEEEFRATGRIVVNVAETDDGYRIEQEGLGVVWSLAVPFIVEGEVWGALGFDYATPFTQHDAAELAALQAVASSVADALLRQRLEARTLAAERRRANDNARHAGLLAKVVQSSRSLIDAEPHAFEPALLRWLGTFGEETRASRATFYDLVTFEATGERTARMLCEWVREGVEGSIEVSFSRPFVIDPRGAEDAFARMTSGEVMVVYTDSMTSPTREFMLQQGNASVMTVPIFIDGRQWGHLSFDYAERHELEPAMVSVLQTAADTLAAVLKRNDAARQALAERDLRVEAERRSLHAESARAEALRHANDELISSMSRLVALQDLPVFLGQLLLALTRTCGARTGALLAFDGSDGPLAMQHCVIDGELVDVQVDPKLELWRQPVPEAAVQEWRSNLAGQVLAFRAVPVADGVGPWPQSEQWHRAMGHRMRLHFPLNIGGQLVGIAGLMLCSDDGLDDFAQQQAVVLAQQAAIAMQMERLARLVESSAVQTERERMAAEIHDNLAQSFTSIAMQSESLAGLLADDPEKSGVLRLIERTARQGLAEARTSVLALLPADGWPGALDQSLAALAERSSIRGGIVCRFVSRGTPCAMPGPVQESLLRIAQEATSNAMRHSGGSQVSIRLDYLQQRLRLTVEDDGQGLPSPDGQRLNGGFGVAGMESRAAVLGGTLGLQASALGGLAVTVDVPCLGVAKLAGRAS